MTKESYIENLKGFLMMVFILIAFYGTANYFFSSQLHYLLYLNENVCHFVSDMKSDIPNTESHND